MLRRRDFLQTAMGASAALFTARLSVAKVASDRRFVFIIQRGAADGLNTVIPFDDAHYEKLRGALAIDRAQSSKLDGTFALHPSLVETAKMYAGGQALFVHAVASPYRERSHFDGQNVLETGGMRPYQLRDGWLNRLIRLVPSGHDPAVALAPTVPLALRGPSEVTSYAASALPEASDDLLARVTRLYADDAELNRLWSAAMQAREAAGDVAGKQDPAGVGALAARFLAPAEGSRVAMIETGGWDTHTSQNGRLALQLKALDRLLAALREGLGASWGHTVVLVATEFGRTAAANGTGGTDHGTASAAWLLGGAINGGRVIADWPGLANGALFEGRDLRPTLSLDALISSTVAETFEIDNARVAQTLFPEARRLSRVEGLIRA